MHTQSTPLPGNMSKKQYGLILRQKHAATRPATGPSVFDDSSDEDDVRAEVNTSLAREGRRKLEAKATRATLMKALSEDPTVFEYDTVYDDIQEHKMQTHPKQRVKEPREPRYIAALRRAAEERKLEQDIMFERKVQKEREQEGTMFADKEAFMTSAYKRAMMERAEMEERLRKEAENEKANDVTKQHDMSRFYQHLLNRQVLAAGSPSQQKDQPTKPSGITTKANEEEEKKKEEEEEEEKKEERTSEQESMGSAVLPSLSDSSAGEAPPTARLSPPSSPVLSKEEQRRIASAKRATEDSLMSARERYLARKKAKLSQPVVVADDD